MMRPYLLGLLGGVTAIALAVVLLVGVVMVRGAGTPATATAVYQPWAPGYVMPVRTVDMNPQPVPRLVLPTPIAPAPTWAGLPRPTYANPIQDQNDECRRLGYSGSNWPSPGCRP